MIAAISEDDLSNDGDININDKSKTKMIFSKNKTAIGKLLNDTKVENINTDEKSNKSLICDNTIINNQSKNRDHTKLNPINIFDSKSDKIASNLNKDSLEINHKKSNKKQKMNDWLKDRLNFNSTWQCVDMKYIYKIQDVNGNQQLFFSKSYDGKIIRKSINFNSSEDPVE